MTLPLALPALQFPIYSLPDEVGPLLAVLKNRIHPGQRSLGKPGWDLLVVDLFPTHVVNIADITYCYKRQNT